MKNFDIGIVGSSLNAAIIAGLIKREHKRKTCLFLSRGIQHQIAREISFSFDIATRPKTLEMTSNAVAESLSIVTSIGGAPALSKISIRLQCHTRQNADMLSHMYHYLHGSEFQIERLSIEGQTSALAAYELRGIRLVQQGVMWPAIFRWLASVGVEIYDPAGLMISSHRDGTASVRLADSHMAIKQIVLADEPSILQHTNAQIVDKLFWRSNNCAIQTLPQTNQNEQLILNPEMGFCAHIEKNGSIMGLANVPLAQMGGVLHVNTGNKEVYRLNARTVFPTLISRDGAPVVGKLGRTQFWGVAGLGHSAVFFAPALARYICDRSNKIESTYFEARGGDSKRDSQVIGESYIAQKEVS